MTPGIPRIFYRGSGWGGGKSGLHITENIAENTIGMGSLNLPHYFDYTIDDTISYFSIPPDRSDGDSCGNPGPRICGANPPESLPEKGLRRIPRTKKQKVDESCHLQWNVFQNSTLFFFNLQLYSIRMKIHIIYREMIINEINNTCPINKRGRPRKLNLESAINELFKLSGVNVVFSGPRDLGFAPLAPLAPARPRIFLSWRLRRLRGPGFSFGKSVGIEDPSRWGPGKIRREDCPLGNPTGGFPFGKPDGIFAGSLRDPRSPEGGKIPDPKDPRIEDPSRRGPANPSESDFVGFFFISVEIPKK